MARQMTRTFILLDNDTIGALEVIESQQYLDGDNPLEEQISQTAWERDDDGADGTGEVVCVGVFNEATEKWEVSPKPAPDRV